MKRCWTWRLSEFKSMELDLLRRFKGCLFCLDVQLVLKRRTDHAPRGSVLVVLCGWKLLEVGFYDVRHQDE